MCGGAEPDCDAWRAVITVFIMALPSVLDEIERLFDELIRRPWGSARRELVPAEIHEVEDGWRVDIPVEGMQAADLKVEVHGRRLTITGQRSRQHERREGQTAWTRTRQEISFQRTITLPAGADPDDIDAKIEGSKLAIHIGRRRP